MDEPVIGQGAASVEVSKIPPGIRWTTMFLDLFVLLTVIPFLGALLACLSCVALAVHDAERLGYVIGYSLLALGAFHLFLLMGQGAAWLAHVMRMNACGGPDPLSSPWPRHPLRAFLSPVLLSTEIFSILYILSWVVVKGMGRFPTTWTWLGFWFLSWGFCLATRLWIARRFPG